MPTAGLGQVPLKIWKCLLLVIVRFTVGHTTFTDFLKCTSGFIMSTFLVEMWQNFIWQ